MQVEYIYGCIFLVGKMLEKDSFNIVTVNRLLRTGMAAKLVVPLISASLRVHLLTYEPQAVCGVVELDCMGKLTLRDGKYRLEYSEIKSSEKGLMSMELMFFQCAVLQYFHCIYSIYFVTACCL